MTEQTVPRSSEPAGLDKDAVIRKMTWRVVPIVFIAYIFAYLDRVNISFAALDMNADLGISAYTYGWLSGIFFVGYFLFAVPSNVMLERLGARHWLSALTIAFGAIALACAFVQNALVLGILRFLLGAAEAGVFPGIIVFLTLWYPAQYRARVLTWFIASAPVSAAIGGPLAGLLLQLDGVLGVPGWRWLFIMEALPAVLLGLAMLFLLTSHPREARWLSDTERSWLVTTLEEEARAVGSTERASTWRTLIHPRVLVLCFAQICVVIAFYGFALWLPQLIAQLTQSNLIVSLLSALPFILAIPVMSLVGRSSDRTGKRSLHTAGSYSFVAIGLIITAFAGVSPWALVGLCLVAMGNFGGQPSFFTLPPMFLTGPAVAVAVGIISSISNLGGFIGPYIVGALKESSGSYMMPLLVLAGLALMGTLAILSTTRWRAVES